ncbi:MAG: hypothetical protein WAV50_02620 [Minisyncoccia bacterium]
MKSIIAVNLYRLSLIIVLGLYGWEGVQSFVSNGKMDEGLSISVLISSFFVLVISIALRSTALYLKARVEWWDFFVIVGLPIFAGLSRLSLVTYGTSFDAIWPSIISISVLVLLIRSFRSSSVS